MSRDTTVALRLFVAFLLIYLGTSKGVLEEVDDVAMLRVTESIVRSGSVAVASDTPGASEGVGGQYFTRYGVGQSLLGIPLYLIGSALPSDVETRNVYDPHGFVLATPLSFAMTGVGIVSTAATVALLYLTARALELPTFASAAAAICLGIGTFAWFYARTFMSEPPSMFFALLAVYAMVRWLCVSKISSARWLALSGAASGALLLMRVGNAPLLPPLGIWLLWTLTSRLRDRGAVKALVAPLAAWLLPIAFALVILGAYNLLRFGSPLATGYGDTAQAFTVPIPVGLYGLLLSPGKSIFLYAPITLAGVAGWFTLRGSHAALAWALAAMTGTYVLFYARYDWWYGAGPWAPRFLTVILPFACVPIAALLSHPLPRQAVATIATLGVASVAIQLVSILVPYLPYDAIMEQDPTTFDRMLWHPAYSPVLVSLRDLLRTTYPPDLAFTYFAIPWLSWLQLVATITGAAALMACLRQYVLRDPRLIL